LELYKLIQSVYPTSPLLIYAQDGAAWANFFNEDYSEAQDIRDKIRNISRQKELPEYIVLGNQYETANILFNRKKYLKSLDIFDNYYKQNPDHYLAPRAYLRAGLCCHQLEYYGQAIEIWEELERKYADKPEAGEALWKVADTYFRAQVYNKAIETYNKILGKYIKDNKESIKAHLRIGQSYYNSKDYSMAVESLRNLILKFPEESGAYEALDFLTVLLEIPESKSLALSALQDLVKTLGIKTPMAVGAQFRLARNYFENKNYSKTVEMLEKLINDLMESERLADSNYYLGESYYQLSEFDKAAQIYKRFVENFPEDNRIISSLFRMGSSYFKAEDYAAATETFEKLVQIYPDTEYSAAAIYNTALAYRKLEQWENATNALQVYKEKYPDLAESQGVDVDIVSIHEEQNQYKKAIEVLLANRKILDAQSEAWGDITFHIAENYMALGEEDNSVAEYQKLISSAGKSPNSWVINAMVRLGEYYEKRDLVKKAVSVYEELYSKAKNMANKPPWLEAIKARIETIRAELKGGEE
jgi:tetratricopeptide (TPR) repeat protein